MKVMFQINYVGGLGADRWIFGGYQDAFEALGHKFFYLPYDDNFQEGVKKTLPDLLFLFSPATLDKKNWEFLHDMRKKGIKVFVFVDQQFASTPEKLAAYRDGDLGDIYWGENEEDYMQDFVRETGHPYVTIPLASNPKYHFPTKPVKKYECDIVFLGAMMPFKREAFEKLLIPLRKKYRVKIFGPNWTVSDNALRLLGLGLRKMRLSALNQVVQKLRVSIPAEEENQLYSSAKICLNIHERGPEQKNHVFLNERGYKIPACGGFEICDNNRALRRYFSPDEVVMADDDDDWFVKIDYYLTHDDERQRIQEAGARRAARDHTYAARVQKILKLAAL